MWPSLLPASYASALWAPLWRNLTRAIILTFLSSWRNSWLCDATFSLLQFSLALKLATNLMSPCIFFFNAAKNCSPFFIYLFPVNWCKMLNHLNLEKTHLNSWYLSVGNYFLQRTSHANNFELCFMTIFSLNFFIFEIL